jgi:hypothetical protein
MTPSRAPTEALRWLEAAQAEDRQAEKCGAHELSLRLSRASNYRRLAQQVSKQEAKGDR